MGVRVPRALPQAVGTLSRLPARRRNARWARSCVPTAMIDADGTVAEANVALTGLLGYRSGALRGVPLHSLLHPEHRAGIQRLRDKLRQQRAGGGERLALHWLKRNGELLRTRAHLEPLGGDGSLRLRLETCTADADPARVGCGSGDLPLGWLEGMAEEIATALLLVDAEGVIRFVNRAAEALFHRDRNEITGSGVAELLGDPLAADRGVMDCIRTALGNDQVERLNVSGRREQGEFSAEVRVVPLTTLPAPLAMLEVRDLTDERRRDAQIRYLMNFDALTGLPNRELFMDRLAQAVARASRFGTAVALACLNVDRFNTFNKTLGHLVGDDLLCEIAERLTGLMRRTDTVARLGGDEFGILIEGDGAASYARCLADRLTDAFRAPILVSGRELFATTGIGFAVHEGTNVDAQTMLRRAEVALSRAKAQGRSATRFYAPELETVSADRLDLETALRHALQRAEFCLHFQPVVRVADGCTEGVEALLRWNHPERGLVGPASFIPVLEETGLINPVGEWLLEEACRQVLAAEGGIPNGLRLAVNVSPEQVRAPGFAAGVERVLRRTGFPARRLELEITETLLMEQTPATQEAFSRLQQAGVTIVVDDFGTGYSSLAYLKRFPVRGLKIDRGFIAGVAADSDDAALVAAIIAMARSLGLAVVAEGVETRAQADFLARWGELRAQGYFFGAPAPLDTLKERPAPTVS